MAFCPECGNQLAPDALTCPRCGAQAPTMELGAATPPPPPTMEVQTPPPTGVTPSPSEMGAFTSPGAASPQGPGTPPPVYPGFPPPTAMKKATSGLAVASLIMGICSFLCLPVIGSILAIILGQVARKQIREESGRLEGKGMATAGMVLGAASLVLLLAVGIPLGFWVYNQVKQPIDATNQFMRHIQEGEYDLAYDMLHPDSPLRDLKASGFRERMRKEFKDLSGWNTSGFEVRTEGGRTYAEINVDVKTSAGGSSSREFTLRKDGEQWRIYDID